MDEEIRRYQRSLERSGISSRAVAFAILVVKRPERYLLVWAVPDQLAAAPAEAEKLLPFAVEKQRVCFLSDRVVAPWRNGWATPVATTELLLRLVESLQARGYEFMLWDNERSARVPIFGTRASNVCSGWFASHLNNALAGRRWQTLDSEVDDRLRSVIETMRSLRSENVETVDELESRPTGGGGDLTLPLPQA